MGAVVTALQIAFVFVLLAVFAWSMKRIGGRRAPAGLVAVPVRAPLTGRASLTVATVGGKAYVLGVTEQQVTLLDVRDAAELNLDSPADADPADPTAPTADGAPPSPPDTLVAALVYTAARAKKAWAARRSPSAPATSSASDLVAPTPQDQAAWAAALETAEVNDAPPSEADAAQDVSAAAPVTAGTVSRSVRRVAKATPMSAGGWATRATAASA